MRSRWRYERVGEGSSGIGPVRCGRGSTPGLRHVGRSALASVTHAAQDDRTSRLLTLATAREGDPMIEFVRRQWRPLLLGLIVLLIVLPAVMLAMAGAR